MRYNLLVWGSAATSVIWCHWGMFQTAPDEPSQQKNHTALWEDRSYSVSKQKWVPGVCGILTLGDHALSSTPSLRAEDSVLNLGSFETV